MKALIISIRKLAVNRISKWGWLWIVILWIFSILYYTAFFSPLAALGLGTYMTLVLLLMLLVGYLKLGPKVSFPWKAFLGWILFFSLIRYLYIYYFLSKHLPAYTIFHYVDRVVPTVIFSSASLLFLGYSYAVYEWGLAAREKYSSKLAMQKAEFQQPLTLRSGGKKLYLLPQDIIYINANGEYVDYNTEEKRHSCFKRLKEVEVEMKPYGFKRTHRSYIVNPDYIETISPTEIVLKNKITLPLSKTYRKDFV